MFATSILAPIASGLLTTLDPTAGNAKLIGCMAFLGVAIGIGIVCPQNLISTALPDKDIPIGISIVGFGGGVGSSSEFPNHPCSYFSRQVQFSLFSLSFGADY